MLDRNTKTFRRTGVAAAVAAIVTHSAPVVAQEIEEITVTATRRAQTVSEIPYNISAVSGDALARNGITDWTKLARSVPGVAFKEAGPRDAGINPGLIIRGLNVEGSGNSDIVSVAAPTVSTYAGETPMFVNLHMKDVERVEVLRGPQGTLYGSGSLGGTIRYIFKDPEFDDFYGEAGTRIGQTNKASGVNSDTWFILNTPFSDKFAARLVAGYVENQGFVDVNGLVTLNSAGHVVAADGSDPIADGNFPGLTDNGDDTWSVAIPQNKFQPLFGRKSDVNRNTIKHARVTFLWAPTDAVNARFTYMRQEDFAGGRQAVNPTSSLGGDMTYTAHILEELERDVELAALDVEAELGFGTLSASVSRYTNDSDVKSDQTGVYVNNYFFVSAYYANSPIDVAFGPYENADEGTTAEVRLVSSGDGPIDYVLGAFWLDQDFHATQHDIFPGIYESLTDYYGTTTVSTPPGFLPDEVFFQRVAPKYEDKALFGEITWHVTDDWQVTGGFRTFDQQVDTKVDLYLLGCGSYCDSDQLPPDSPLIGLGANSTFRSQSFNDTIFKFNTSYKLSDNLMTYVTWAEGFRHGGANATVTNPNSALFDDPRLADYKSDVATNIEVGLKGSAVEGRLGFSATFFWIDWKDMQFFAYSDGSAVPIIANAKEAESKGFELESSQYWSDAFTTRLGLGITNAELTADFVAPGDVTAGFSGDRLPGVPDLTVNASMTYVQALSEGHEIAYNLGAVYVDKIQTDFNELAPQYTVSPSYTLVDLSATYSADSWEVSLFVDNVTDERAPGNARSRNGWATAPYTSDGSFFSAHSNDDFYLFQHIARPRTIGLGLKYKF